MTVVTRPDPDFLSHRYEEWKPQISPLRYASGRDDKFVA